MFSNLPNSKPPCGHSGSPLVVEGVQLKCCDSSAKTCKIKEMSRLLRENMNLSEKVVELERKVAELEKKTEVAQNKPTTVNNYIYVESYNVNAILNDDVAVELIQAGLKGKDIFNGFYEICQKSNNPEAKKLVQKINSGPAAQIEVKKSILQKLENVSASEERVPKRYKKDVEGYIGYQKQNVEKERARLEN